MLPILLNDNFKIQENLKQDPNSNPGLSCTFVLFRGTSYRAWEPCSNAPINVTEWSLVIWMTCPQWTNQLTLVF